MAANERSQKQSSVSKRNNKKSIDGKRSASRDTESNTYVSTAKEPTPARSQAGITRSSADTAKKTTKKSNPLSRAASAVKSAVRKITTRGKKSGDVVPEAAAPPARGRSSKAGAPKAARLAKRDGDIGIERIESTYTPPQTSLKAGFRATGADRQHDQEFVRGVADDRWNDEDLLTNKSGDSRIGTHGRTYEPGEARKDPQSD
jgi:hypothetical protein